MEVFNEWHNHLYEVIKLWLNLSHENVKVSKSGFSVYSEITENNLKELSVVSQRIVYEGIMKEGRLMKVRISNEIIDYVGRFQSLSSGTERAKRTKRFMKRNFWKDKRVDNKKNYVHECSILIEFVISRYAFFLHQPTKMVQ